MRQLKPTILLDIKAYAEALKQSDQIAINQEYFDVALSVIESAHQFAIKKHPKFPVNEFEGLTVATEELGEVARAMLEHKHSNGTRDQIIKEAAQTAATCIRMIQYQCLLNVKERTEKESSGNVMGDFVDIHDARETQHS